MVESIKLTLCYLNTSRDDDENKRRDRQHSAHGLEFARDFDAYSVQVCNKTCKYTLVIIYFHAKINTRGIVFCPILSSKTS